MRRSTRVRLISPVVCLALATVWTVLAVPGTTVGKGKPDKPPKPGGDTTPPTCVLFDDNTGDGIKSDGGGEYCHDKEANVKVSIGSDGHLVFKTKNNSKKAGRSLFIDFGQEITIIDSKGDPVAFQTTDQLEDWGAEPYVNMTVGGFQDDFNMLEMYVGETRTDVNLQSRLIMRFPGHNMNTFVRIALAPEPITNERHCPGSDSVAVTYWGVNTDGLKEWTIIPASTGLAGVTQNEFAPDDVTVGFIPLQFGFTVTAP